MLKAILLSIVFIFSMLPCCATFFSHLEEGITLGLMKQSESSPGEAEIRYRKFFQNLQVGFNELSEPERGIFQNIVPPTISTPSARQEPGDKLLFWIYLKQAEDAILRYRALEAQISGDSLPSPDLMQPLCSSTPSISPHGSPASPQAASPFQVKTGPTQDQASLPVLGQKRKRDLIFTDATPCQKTFTRFRLQKK